MILEKYRPSGLKEYFSKTDGWGRMDTAWLSDEFVLDPTRVTAARRSHRSGWRHVQKTVDGQIRYADQQNVAQHGLVHDSHRHDARHDCPPGECADRRSPVIWMTNSIAGAKSNWTLHAAKVRSLNEDLPPLPNFSRFHPAFQTTPDCTTPEGDLRRAFYLAYEDTACEYIKLEDGSLLRAIESGQEIVSAAFITPYPPGFPVLVPGQVISREIVQFLMALDVKEIHGYEPAYGLRIFTAEPSQTKISRAGGMRI